MELKTGVGSSVSILAIDKRVTYLATGNDLSTSSVTEPYNKRTEWDLLVDDTSLLEWKTCTAEQTKLFEHLTQISSSESDTLYYHGNGDQMISEPSINPVTQDDDSSQNTNSNSLKEDVREHFPETWIFETINVDKDAFIYENKVPDSITSWIISAFSLNEENGFAVAKPVELIVSKDFFMKTNVPNFVYPGEVVKVDVLIFNYFDGNQNLSGNVELSEVDSNTFKIVNFEREPGECVSFISSDNKMQRDFDVNSRGSVKVSFYIQPIKVGKLKLKLSALASAGSSLDHYSDIIKRTINVEHNGLRHTKNNDPIHYHSFKYESKTFYSLSKCFSTDIAVSGDFISNSMSTYDQFDIKR